MNFDLIFQYPNYKPYQRLGSFIENYSLSIVDSRFWLGRLIIPSKKQLLGVDVNLTDEGVVENALLRNCALQGYLIPAHLAYTPLVDYELLHLFLLET